jgi:hypothetical protein
VAVLDADPVLEELGQLNPFRLEPTWRERVGDRWCEAVTLDGVGYTLRWGTRAVRGGRFAFPNPSAPWLLQLERVLFCFARQVVSASAVVRFNEQLRCWVKYRESVKAVGRGAAAERPRD